MLRLNRARIVGLSLTIFIIYFLFSSSSSTETDFRRRTEDGIARRHGVLRGDLSDEDLTAQTNEKLQKILDGKAGTGIQQKDNPDLSSHDQVKEVKVDAKVDTSVGGRKTMPKADSEKPKYPMEKSQSGDQERLDVEEKEGVNIASGDPGKDFARKRLQEYLKKPVVIFSKSYCPHSKRAKQLLLEVYSIVPEPLVVELDQLTEKVPTHRKSDAEDDDDEPAPQTLGHKIQGLLHEITGRRTVPNIVIGMESIGGNDLIWDLHEDGDLADKIKKLGGKVITSVELRDKTDGSG